MPPDDPKDAEVEYSELGFCGVEDELDAEAEALAALLFLAAILAASARSFSSTPAACSLMVRALLS